MLLADLNESDIWLDGGSYFHQVLLLWHTSNNIKTSGPQRNFLLWKKTATPSGSSEKRFKWLAQKAQQTFQPQNSFGVPPGPLISPWHQSKPTPYETKSGCFMNEGCYFYYQAYPSSGDCKLVTDQACWEVPRFKYASRVGESVGQNWWKYWGSCMIFIICYQPMMTKCD